MLTDLKSPVSHVVVRPQAATRVITYDPDGERERIETQRHIFRVGLRDGNAYAFDLCSAQYGTGSGLASRTVTPWPAYEHGLASDLIHGTFEHYTPAWMERDVATFQQAVEMFGPTSRIAILSVLEYSMATLLRGDMNWLIVKHKANIAAIMRDSDQRREELLQSLIARLGLLLDFQGKILVDPTNMQFQEQWESMCEGK